MVVFHDTAWDIESYLSLPNREGWPMGVPRFVEELRRSGYPIITLTNDCGVSLVQPRIGGLPLRVESAMAAW